ncbi:MAG: sulfite exporter TauE/SafE family protein [Candidatus Eisenbacteria bacterium]
MIAVAGSVLLASLLGSPHCAGMCGGFVCFYAGQGGRGQFWAHVAYNLGRLGSYLLLGLLAGLLGRTLDQAGAGAGLHRTAAVAAGAVMIVWGVTSLLAALGVKLPHGGSFPLLGGRFAAVMRAVHAQPPVVRALTVGAVTTLLPCGWLWVYVATAAGTGSVAGALLVMAAFWAGTVPMMAGIGLAAQSALGPLRRHLPILTAATLVVLGLATIGGRFHLSPVGARCEECARTEAHVGH